MNRKRRVAEHLFDENLSASRVKKFATCPLKWWFSYSRKETRTKPEKGYREKGDAVHKAIENTLLEDETIRDAGILSHRFKEKFRQKNPDIPEKMYEDGLDCCDNAAKYLQKFVEPDAIRDIEVEHQFHVGGEVNESFNAKIDLTTDTSVVDWKTGNALNADGEHADYRKRDELIQGMVYAAAYLNKYGEYPKEVVFVYLGDGEVSDFTPDREKWTQAKQYARALLQAMGSGEFPANPGEHCSFCDYEYVCPAQDTSMANVTYEKY